ncbi:hypothetical protein ACIPYV_02870 [Paenarthrobacter nicotinovorans]
MNSITGWEIPSFGPLKAQASYRSVKFGSAIILMLKARGPQHH